MTILEFKKNNPGTVRFEGELGAAEGAAGVWSSGSSGTGTPNSVIWAPNSGSTTPGSSGARTPSGSQSVRSNISSGDGNLKEKVKVCVRMRPFHEHEKVCPLKQVLCVLGNRVLVKEHVHPQWPKCREAGPLQFKVDYVQDDSFLQTHIKEKKEESQKRMFEVLGLPTINNALEGFNTTILAYGQMGSGKTYTMTGDGTPEGRGLIPRLANALMTKLNWELKNGLCTIEVSYLEIYQEKIRDLLAAGKPTVDSAGPIRYYERADDLSTSDSEISETDTTDSGGMEAFRRFSMQRGGAYQYSSFSFNGPTCGARSEFLRVREHPITGPYVEGLLWEEVSTWSEMEKSFKLGSANRTTGDTQLYKNSSRSHTLFTIKISRRNPEYVEGMPGHSISYINLVDLAGSEKLQCIPLERREESRHINRSLSLLNEVILNLSRRSFVSYRNSALTWLLRESLGGNSKTFLVANISPAEKDFQESVSTLRYASKANRIQSILTVGNDPRKRLIYKMNEEICTLSSLVSSLTEKVIAYCRMTQQMFYHFLADRMNKLYAQGLLCFFLYINTNFPDGFFAILKLVIATESSRRIGPKTML